MRYTEKKQDLEVATNSGFLRTLFLKVLRSPYTIISEMGMKIPFLEKRILERILVVAILIATAIVAATCFVRFSTGRFSLTAGTMPLIFMLGGLLVLIALYFVLIGFNAKVYDQMSQLTPSYAEESEVKEDLHDLCETESTEATVHTEVEPEEEEIPSEPEVPASFDNVDFDELDLDSLDDLDSTEVSDMNDLLQDFDSDNEIDVLDEKSVQPLDTLAEKPARSLDGCDNVVQYQNRNQTFIESLLGTTIGDMPQDEQEALMEEIERNENTLTPRLEDLARAESVADDFDGDDLVTWDVPEDFILTA